MALVAMSAFVLIVIIIAILCVTGSSAKYRREKRSRSIDSLQLADGNFASFQLKGTSATNMTRSRELPTRPGTTQSWLSDQSREPPTYGSVLGDGRNSAGVMNMYGLATDVIPPLPNSGPPPHTSMEAMQKLSALVGRDIRSQNTAYVTPSARGSDGGRNDYMPTRSDQYATRSDYGRVEYRGHIPSSSASSQLPNPDSPQQAAEAYDSFDEEEDVESVDDTVIRGDRTLNDGAEDIARHYGSTDHYRDTWRKVRETDMVRAPILTSQQSSAAGRSSTTESTSEGPWATVPATPNQLTTGFSSFV
uniref:Uncharacterized protein n=1 Tax=Caenorhabditis japonica TaxID=281687 RepID=A0A8R1ENP7_CAEJA